MEAKVKEELPDKDYNQPTSTERRKSTASGKERPSPEQEEARSSPTPGPPSPGPQNGTAALSSTESLSPPLPEGSRGAPALQRLRKFLSALQQFATDVGTDTGERVRQLIFNLVAGVVTIEEFQAGVQECTNYPLRASVPGFLRALLPLAQRDLHAKARRLKLTPLQYIRSHEHLILETSGEGDIFLHQGSAEPGAKRRASDPFYDTQTNGSHDDYPPHAKRPSLFNPSPFYPLPSNASLFDYHPCNPYQPPEPALERRDGGIAVRDVSSMSALPEPRPAGIKNEDEWKNINTMLNCILSMVEKTKRALAILQQRSAGVVVEQVESADMKRTASEIMAAAVRQTEERVAEVRRRAEDAVTQAKRQALVELQRAALELSGRRSPPAPPPARDLSPAAAAAPHHNCCWNCGRKAQETCSGCGAARYCGAFCQHKDWENHHQVCSGRDQKPTAMLRSSPPIPTTLTKTLPRATTPITTQPPTTDSRLTITTLTDRLTTIANDRIHTNTIDNRITLSTAQGIIGGIGGKK